MSYIPATIVYVAQPATKSKSYGAEHEDMPLCNTYVVNGDSKSQLKTAQRTMGEPREEVTVLNEDIPYIRVLRHRFWCKSSGRDAFTVVVHDKYVVDMSTETMAAAVKYGRAENGLIYGPFRWVVDSNVHLSHISSHEYRTAQEETERRNALKIGARKLVVGGLYSSVHKYHYLYLGRVDTEHVDCRTTSLPGRHWSSPSSLRHTYKIGPLVERHCFLYVRDDLKQAHIDHYIKTGGSGVLDRLEVRSIPDLVEKVGEFDVSGLLIASYTNAVNKAEKHYYCRSGYALLMRRKGEPRPKLPAGEMGDAINAIK